MVMRIEVQPLARLTYQTHDYRTYDQRLWRVLGRR